MQSWIDAVHLWMGVGGLLVGSYMLATLLYEALEAPPREAAWYAATACFAAFTGVSGVMVLTHLEALTPEAASDVIAACSTALGLVLAILRSVCVLRTTRAAQDAEGDPAVSSATD